MQINSVVIVTGASQGGRATAIRLARDFQAFVLAAKSKEFRMLADTI